MKRYILFFLLISSIVFSQDLKFGSYSSVTAKNYQKGKWDSSVKNAYNKINESEYSTAITLLEKAFASGLNNNEIYKDYILCIIETRDMGKVESIIKNATKNPYIKAIYDKIGTIYIEELKENEKGIAYLEKAEKYEKIADIYNKERKYELAAEYYGKAGLYEKAGDILFNLNKIDAAIGYYEKQQLYEKIIKIYLDLKQYEKTFEYYKKIGKEKEGYKVLADYYFDIKEYRKALDNYKKAGLENEGIEKIFNAYKSEGKEDEGYKILANTYFLYKDNEEAEEYYKKRLQDNINNDIQREKEIAMEKNRKYYYEKEGFLVNPDDRIEMDRLKKIKEEKEKSFNQRELILIGKIYYLQKYGATSDDINEIEKYFKYLSKASIRSVLGFPQVDTYDRWVYKYIFKYYDIRYDIWIEFENDLAVKISAKPANY